MSKSNKVYKLTTGQYVTTEYTCSRTKEQSKSIRQRTMGQPVTTKCIAFAIGTTEQKSV